MKMLIRSIGMILLVVSPLFSALLTDDLEVISPTGIPLSREYNEQVFFTPSSNYTITIRFMETSRGVLLVREYTKGGVVQLSHTIVNPGASLIIINSSGRVREEDITNKNVILE
ncbi:MAG: hypothetical protein ISR87_11530 [Candidatus Marinimicrobia bacterium]|nr:hypothetical protein [FCB group bacterium]MBL7026079.1 hypothetical protein [Candidatus Neomarinimicrobiota bacterium]